MCICGSLCVQISHSRPKPSALEMAMVSFCLSSFLVRYGGKQIWLKQVWEIGSLQREKEKQSYTVKHKKVPVKSLFHQPFLLRLHHFKMIASRQKVRDVNTDHWSLTEAAAAAQREQQKPELLCTAALLMHSSHDTFLTKKLCKGRSNAIIPDDKVSN